MAFHKKDKEKALSLQESLCNLFPIKKLGEANSFLGLNIYRDRSNRKLWLVRKGYIQQICNSYNLKSSHRAKTPWAPDYDMSPDSGPKLSTEPKQLYQRKVGSAVYTSICTRPDISLAVSMCADYLVNPAMRHLNAITNVLQYLCDTENYGIIYDCQLLKTSVLHEDILMMA